MSGFENRKGQELRKPIAGRVGRMINIFDLSSGMPRAKLLTDKPHRDGSPSNRNRPEMKKRPIETTGVGDNPVANDHRKSSSKKSGGIPMKKLIAQELSREMESKQKQSNVVARLMGLDALPVQQSDPTPKLSLQEGYSHKLSSRELQCHRHLQGDSHPNPMKFDTPSSDHETEYKDVDEVWQQPSRDTRSKDQPPTKGRYNENSTEKRMELIRQKFSEAKRLATDERLLQSEEFQDALEVLSSNRDLFLKFLEEPNSLFPKHLHGMQTIPASLTKRITVLKPSKTIEAKGEAEVTKHLYPAVEGIVRDINNKERNSRSTNSIHHKAENISQPTRIVVLKPSPGKPNEMKTMVAPPITPPMQQEGRDLDESLGTDESIESRELAQEITRKMQQHLSSHRKDEALLSSSALSNGYVGDESSFNRSENDFNEEGCGNISDSEVLTPTSRHSWDYSNRFGSPCSISSFSRPSCSPESSVIREAKKRLSERWALVASNDPCQGKNQMRRSSSTLGEMLAIYEVKKEEETDNLSISSRRSCSGEHELKASVGCFSSGGMKVTCGEDSPRNLARSKSLPVSSLVYENGELKEAVPDHLSSKNNVPKDVAKSKSGVSSFKGKVSSFFFSKSKKSGREKHTSPPLDCDNRLHSSSSEAHCKRTNGSSDSSHDSHSEERMPINSEKNRGTLSAPNSLSDGLKHVTPSAKAACSVEKPRTSKKSRETQDQPSPISVLEAPFDDHANNISQSSPSAICGHPQALSRSSPIESVSRTLTRDSPHLGRPLSNSSKFLMVLSKEREEQERFAFVQKLLSSASLTDSGDYTILARWHSLDSPLDPMLLNEFLDRKEEGAKSRERRSNQRLLFDCVNAALLDIGWSTLIRSYPYARACDRTRKDGQSCYTQDVWRLLRDWFSSEEKQITGNNENRNVVVEGLVKQDISGSGWSKSMCSEIDEFSREIGRALLEELVEEALADLTDECL